MKEDKERDTAEYWKNKFHEMRKNCRTANKGAERNAEELKKLTKQFIDLRNKDRKDLYENMELKRENESLHHLLHKAYQKIDKKQMEIYKLRK